MRRARGISSIPAPIVGISIRLVIFLHLRALLGGFHQSRPRSWRIFLRAASRGVAACVLPSPTQTQRGACAPSAVQQAARRPSQTGVRIASTSADPVDPQHLTKTDAQPCRHLLAQGCAKATHWLRSAPLHALCSASSSGGAAAVSRRRNSLPGDCRHPARIAGSLSS